MEIERKKDFDFFFLLCVFFFSLRQTNFQVWFFRYKLARNQNAHNPCCRDRILAGAALMGR